MHCYPGVDPSRCEQCDAVGNVSLGNLGFAFHIVIPLTCITNLNSFHDHVHPFMETVIPDGHFQQDNVHSAHCKNSSGMI